jgi:hypothetical protein
MLQLIVSASLNKPSQTKKKMRAIQAACLVVAKPSRYAELKTAKANAIADDQASASPPAKSAIRLTVTVMNNSPRMSGKRFT